MKGNAKVISPDFLPGLAEVIERSTWDFSYFMARELVLRCRDCNQVLQVSDEQTTAFTVVGDGCLCKACELLNSKKEHEK